MFVTFKPDPSQMHSPVMMTMISQLTASVCVICTLPSSGTFSKVWRILAPLMDTSIVLLSSSY